MEDTFKNAGGLVHLKNREKVGAYGDSTVTAYGNSTVVINNVSANKRKNIDLKGNSTLKDCKTKSIYQSGDWKFVKVGEDNQ
ncbi:hypothetical protein AGMMS49975_26640 [Clostridia bacterium]|nr:hypothetical protein AGMMS49975_26640 [Clostridia bacterium]